MNDDELLIATRIILQKEPDDRTKEDLFVLSKYFKENSIFEKLKLDLNDQTLREQLFLSMRILVLSKDDFVFKYGDLGDKFYIIMSGKVSISVPIFNSEHIGEEPSTEENKEENTEDSDKIKTQKFVVVGEMAQGKSFGELACLHSKARMATIQCLQTPTEFITICK